MLAPRGGTAGLLLAAALAAPLAHAAHLPATMQAAAIDRAGGPEVLTLHTLPVPHAAADEVLMAVHTAGVGIWDTGLRRHPEEISHSKLPLVLGTDGAGTVVAVGKSVARFKVGDKVYAYSWDNPQGGFYAEYVAVPAERAGPVPKNLDLAQAGAIATTGLTALQGVDDALHVQRGQTLLIHGAAGGVGTLSVQFAKARGARVLATASGEDELALVRGLGADAVVDGRSGDILAAARQFAPQGVDAVLAFAGGESLERCLDALRPGGLAAYPRGVRPPKPRAGLSVIDYDAIPGPQQYAQLNALIESLPLRVPIAAQFPLAEAAKAHARIEAGHVLGKIVINIH